MRNLIGPWRMELMVRLNHYLLNLLLLEMYDMMMMGEAREGMMMKMKW